MGSLKRISYFFYGILMLVCGTVMMVFPDQGYEFVILILELSLFIRAIRTLAYYFFMARHMVGGIRIFYHGLLLLDAGVFALYVDDMPRMYVMMYLVGYMIFNGIVDMAYANEERKQKFNRWKYQMAGGCFQIWISAICLFHLNSVNLIAMVYGFGMIHSAITHIMTAFRKTAIVYVQ